MCDTIVALANSTQDGSVLFAKNSDRDPNEAHEVVLVQGQKHTSGSTVKCTYIEIPQVEETYKILLCKPFWIWGAEMGSNEFGVTIGNEAVFTKIPYDKKPGLIGMDFLRLALERSKTALAGLKTITTLLEEFGQSGNCGFSHPMFYHNSFLICDTKEAWVLETAGREWAAEKVKDVRTISNAITIGAHWDLASKNLVSYAMEKGWCKKESEFNFAKCYSDFVYTRFSDAKNRQVCTTRNLMADKGKITTRMMMSTLREHNTNDSQKWQPDDGISGADVCMHAGWGPIRGSQTTGSLVSHLGKELITHWVTGTSAPCSSVFKPLWIDSGLPEMGSSPRGTFDHSSMFWKHEELHREILKDYQNRISVLSAERGQFEDSVVADVAGLRDSSSELRLSLSNSSLRKAEQLEENWLKKIQLMEIQKNNAFLYKTAWKQFNKAASMPN
jgi:secernin